MLAAPDVSAGDARSAGSSPPAALIRGRDALSDIRPWRIIGRVELVETSIFTKRITSLLGDDDYRKFQARLAANPEIGSLIKGGGGIRKVRVAFGSRGKSGGARVVYYWAAGKDVILLLYAYAKNVAADMTPKQVSQLAAAVKEEFGQ